MVIPNSPLSPALFTRSERSIHGSVSKTFSKYHYDDKKEGKKAGSERKGLPSNTNGEAMGSN